MRTGATCDVRLMSATELPPTARTVMAAAMRQSAHVRRVGPLVARDGGLGSALTTRATSTRSVGAKSIERMARNNSSSSRQSAHAARCATTSACSFAAKRSFSRSGSRSRISAFTQSFIEKLLHRAHGIVVVHPRGSFGGSYRFGNFLVRESIRYTKCEHLALRRRQSLDGVAQSSLGFIGDHGVERVVFGGGVRLLKLVAVAAALVRAPPVE